MKFSFGQKLVSGLALGALLSCGTKPENITPEPKPIKPDPISAAMYIPAKTIVAECSAKLNATETAFTAYLKQMSITALGFSSSIVPDNIPDGAIPSTLILQKNNLTPINALQDGSAMARWQVNNPNENVVVIKRTNVGSYFQKRYAKSISAPDTLIEEIHVGLSNGSIQTNWNKTFPFTESAPEITGNKEGTFIKTTLADNIPGAKIIPLSKLDAPTSLTR